MQFVATYLEVVRPILSIPVFTRICRLLYPWLLGISLLFLAIGTVGGLYLTPADYQQGEAFRIIYVHVPAAILSLAVYMLLAACGISYLIFKFKIANLLMRACAPLGAGFTLIALVTGALWGKPMWGTWWIWDARLTSELILLFLYIGQLALRNIITQERLAAQLCSLLAIIGAIDIPIIHFSVDWWYTLHQGSTLLRFSQPAIPMTMAWPLFWMISGFALYFSALVCQRVVKYGSK